PDRLGRGPPHVRMARIVVLGLHRYEIEVVAAGASGDLAYLVAFEHTTASVNGAPPESYTLRSPPYSAGRTANGGLPTGTAIRSSPGPAPGSRNSCKPAIAKRWARPGPGMPASPPTTTIRGSVFTEVISTNSRLVAVLEMGGDERSARRRPAEPKPCLFHRPKEPWQWRS